MAALFGQLTVATKIACSQILYFLFKVHRARMIKNKNVLEKNEKNRTTSVYRLLRKCEAFEFGFGFNNHESFAKARKHESSTKAYTKARLSILVPVPFLFRVDPQNKPPMQDGGCFAVYRTRPDKYPSHSNPSSNPTVNES